MALLKIVKDEYKNEDALDNVVKYVLNRYKMPSWIWGGSGISMYAPAESMHIIKRAYDKTTGKQVEHIILAFSKKEQRLLCKEFILQVACDICNFFWNVQVLFGVHERKNTYIADDYDEDCIHIHFVVNTVDIRSGNKFWIDHNTAAKLQSYVKTVLINNQVSRTVQLVMDTL